MLKFNNISLVFSLISGFAVVFSMSSLTVAKNASSGIEAKFYPESDFKLSILQKLNEPRRIDLAGLAIKTAQTDKSGSACTGLFVSYSTESGEIAADGNGNNSPYTQALASFLTQSELTLQKLSKKVRKAVVEGSSSINQKPMFIDATSCEYQLTEKAESRPRFALVIGNGNYSAVPALKNPGNDAKLIAGKLIELNFQVNLMIDRSYEQMKSAITELKTNMKNSGNGSVVVIFLCRSWYTGRGSKLLDSRRRRCVQR